MRRAGGAKPRKPRKKDQAGGGARGWFAPRWLWTALAAAVVVLAVAIVAFEVHNKRRIESIRLLHSIRGAQEVAGKDTRETAPAEERSLEGDAPRAPAADLPAPASDTAVPPEENARPWKGRVAIIIDDLGWDLGIAQDLADLGAPLTFSVLPHAPYTRKVAELAHGAGLEVLLHLPMEPEAYPDVEPGEGALLISMNEVELLQSLDGDLATVPYATGVNNHMGSRFTSDATKMEKVLGEVKARGLFFIDSVTSKNSVGYRVARSIGLPTMKRDMFLDHVDDRDLIRGKLDRLIEIALEQGHAIAIGHPRPNTYQALREILPAFSARGVNIVPVSYLFDEGPGGDTSRAPVLADVRARKP